MGKRLPARYSTQRSVKHEEVYLKGYAGVPELLMGLTEYFTRYNTERSHQSLGYRTPEEVYRTACGSGARIGDKFSDVRGPSKATAIIKSGQRRSAASEPLPSSIRFGFVLTGGPFKYQQNLNEDNWPLVWGQGL
jgi:hypothetical protein